MDQLFADISAAGTLVAMGVSLFLLRQGQQDRRALRDERRRQQASLVTCWCDWDADSQLATLGRPDVPAIFVRNASDQAVYQVFVDYIDPSDGRPVRIDIGPIPPVSTRSRDVDVEVPSFDIWEPSSLLPRVFFTDAGGQAWMRTIRGRLERDPGPHNDGFAEDGGRLNLGLPRPSRNAERSTE